MHNIINLSIDVTCLNYLDRAVLEGKDKGTPYDVTFLYCHATNVKKIANTSKVVHTHYLLY